MKAFFKALGRAFRSFFYCGDDFQPVYFYTAIFLAQIVWLIQLKIRGAEYVTDALVLGMFGGIIGLLGIYNWYKKGNGVSKPAINTPEQGKISTETAPKAENGPEATEG